MLRPTSPTHTLRTIDTNDANLRTVVKREVGVLEQCFTTIDALRDVFHTGDKQSPYPHENTS